MNFFQSFFRDYETTKKLSYENIQDIITCKNNSYPNDDIFLINTLPEHMQDVLIPQTLSFSEEEDKINNLINRSLFQQKIVIYGKNNSDETLYKKYVQLKKYGFLNLYLYIGGLFEWLLMQDIYGKELFPTIGFTLNILKYKPNKYNLKN